MPVVVVPGTPMAAEVLKWEYEEYRIGDERGQRGPRVFIEYPKAMFKAERNAQNKIAIVKQITVGDETEERQQFAHGFRTKQEDALELRVAEEREIAKLAANRAFNDRKMSPEAQAEAAEYEQSVSEHVAEIPAKKRGRPRKEEQE